jgi:hypothetical protein
VTRVRAQFNTPGQFVWHCHIVEHEDNEMMRPYRIGPVQPGQPGLSLVAAMLVIFWRGRLEDNNDSVSVASRASY